ncbi:hemolysin type calcium-binding protein [Nitrosomonas nitrosa]|uniref:calcium-binding protein n=1 Tax=Nitrosomonas nitrosa TaxID=52442 RepID=UPI000D2F58CF|nr:calcium-binding protein [Nitrosomonas nitrosa]PTR00642.1 hemolysin type calcium-binding protein [Nitrosomonas nitrosa]
MAVITERRPNIGTSGLIEFIDGIPFEGFGSGGFGPNDLQIIGDDEDNLLQGGIGHDMLEGKGGNDTLQGGGFNDTLFGDAGNDVLDGQEGTDKLYGGPGDDLLWAGHDHDRLTGDGGLGEKGNDIFGFYALGHFQISDFTLGQDRLLFDSERLGVNSVEELVSHITNTHQTAEGVTVEFGPDASIELVGINLNDITADMVIFNL